MSNLEEHEAEQARITAECEAGECDHPECHEAAYDITMSWHDQPEGGTFRTTVMAKDSDDAEAKSRYEMADSYFSEAGRWCRHCGECSIGDGHDGFCGDCADRIENGEELADTDAALDKIVEEYAHQWDVIDCFKVSDHVDANLEHSKIHRETNRQLGVALNLLSRLRDGLMNAEIAAEVDALLNGEY